ncbi:MAG: NUDIX domain-containing protein [Desulfobacterales bacterium]|nr:NUDIX domain-containing protein [Desulfobacterales bacterium]MBS3756598.1 NUDIX domain-containing protein [Desulfobacterales bacterium]
MDRKTNTVLGLARHISATRWGRVLCAPLLRRWQPLEIVDENGRICGVAPRKQAHGDNRLLHRVVHVLVFDRRGRLLLQKRSMQKQVAPGRWDTSVGGHVDFGETVEEAMHREMSEELGICPAAMQFAYCYIHANDFESELVYTYICGFDGEIRHNPAEISEVRFWNPTRIAAAMGTGKLSENFEDEFRRYQNWNGQDPYTETRNPCC